MCVELLSWRAISGDERSRWTIEFALTFGLCPMMLRRVEGACLDTARMTLSAMRLAATVYALIESQHAGCTDPMVITPSVIGLSHLPAS
jgi:hypothetical protein